jgi:hypothetical protein
VTVGVLSRPQSGTADFYRELGDLFGVTLTPHNRWAGSKALREKWLAHIESSLFRPVLIIDEAQEMKPIVLAELRLMSSMDLDARSVLTVASAATRACRRSFGVRTCSRSRAVWACASRWSMHHATSCSRA